MFDPFVEPLFYLIAAYLQVGERGDDSYHYNSFT